MKMVPLGNRSLNLGYHNTEKFFNLIEEKVSEIFGQMASTPAKYKFITEMQHDSASLSVHSSTKIVKGNFYPGFVLKEHLIQLICSYYFKSARSHHTWGFTFTMGNKDYFQTH